MRKQHESTSRGFDERGPLHTCLVCACDYVYLVEARSMGLDGKPALLRCPNCGVHRAGVFARGDLEALERRRQAGEDQLRSHVRRLEIRQRLEQIDRFAEALDAGAILPEDF